MRSLSEPEGTLSLILVSTPIGNLKDLSPRAIEALQSADYILCEDTRRAQKLKTHFGLKPRLISFHEHNEKVRLPKIIALMRQGKRFALISDAGTPLISDPGFLLVREMIRQDLPFTCIPGPSAVTTAMLLSGFPSRPFTFIGFLPTAPGDRNRQLQELAALNSHTIVLFESPERIIGLLREIGETLGDRNLALCREMTKLHEEVLRGTVSEIVQQLSTRKIVGEFTVVIGPGEAQVSRMTDETIRARSEQLQKEGLSRKDILKRLVRESGRSRNELYDLLFR